MEDALDQLLEAWRTNNRINLMVIDAIVPAGMKATLSTRGGRSVARQFAHLHNNRLWHLEKRARPLTSGLVKFATADEPTKAQLKKALKQSEARIATYFEQYVGGVPGLRCFKKGPIVYLGYFISHEAHHRGNILLTLKQCGHALDKAPRYDIWDWDRR